MVRWAVASACSIGSSRPRVINRSSNTTSIAEPAAVLLAGLIGGTVLGLIGALMAIPIAAGLKVVLAEQLHARDTRSDGGGA